MTDASDFSNLVGHSGCVQCASKGGRGTGIAVYWFSSQLESILIRNIVFPKIGGPTSCVIFVTELVYHCGEHEWSTSYVARVACFLCHRNNGTLNIGILSDGRASKTLRKPSSTSAPGLNTEFFTRTEFCVSDIVAFDMFNSHNLYLIHI